MNEHNNHDVQNFLTGWENNEITITKEQNRDIDITKMKLNSAAFHERHPTIDGYVAPFVLQLHGSGSVMTDNNNYEPLPYLTFDIPMDEEYQSHISNEQLHIQTEDSKYTISRKEL